MRFSANSFTQAGEDHRSDHHFVRNRRSECNTNEYSRFRATALRPTTAAMRACSDCNRSRSGFTPNWSDSFEATDLLKPRPAAPDATPGGVDRRLFGGRQRLQFGRELRQVTIRVVGPGHPSVRLSVASRSAPAGPEPQAQPERHRERQVVRGLDAEVVAADDLVAQLIVLGTTDPVDKQVAEQESRATSSRRRSASRSRSVAREGQRIAQPHKGVAIGSQR